MFIYLLAVHGYLNITWTEMSTYNIDLMACKARYIYVLLKIKLFSWKFNFNLR